MTKKTTPEEWLTDHQVQLAWVTLYVRKQLKHPPENHKQIERYVREVVLRELEEFIRVRGDAAFKNIRGAWSVLKSSKKLGKSYYSFSLSHETNARLDELAKYNSVSRSEIIERLVALGMDIIDEETIITGRRRRTIRNASLRRSRKRDEQTQTSTPDPSAPNEC